jgi:5-hydroxyisourate hydrolase-like protein (transthyretin family)
MKKKIILVSVLLLLATNVFSKGIYNGNFQITGGYNVNQLSITEDAEPFIKMNTVNFGLETWHLFKLPLLLEVGFMFDMD